MQKILLTIIGRDRPGIVYLISNILATHKCNIVQLTQTTLMGQFAGLFSTNCPESLKIEDLSEGLSRSLLDSGLSFWVTPTSEIISSEAVAREPYVITISGSGNYDLISDVTKIVASFEANIDNMRTVTLSSDSGSTDESSPLILVLEISVPSTVQQKVFRQALSLTASELGVEINMQHRDIFEAIHRI
jgi:glycine cleavage system transcriptional repressor